MLPKSGDPAKTENWRPIAILRILYKIFAKMLWQRISTTLEAQQCKDQCAYRPGYGVDDALHSIEYMTGFAHAFKTDLWIVSLDLSKAFDKVYHECAIQAILEQWVDEAHACLLQELYWQQTGQVGTSSVFELSRGVRQGDVLSPCLFNAVMEMVFRRWKARLTDQGWQIPGLGERFTDVRFADDVLLYARTLEEAKLMLSLLMEELQRVGFSLGSSKTKILTIAHVEISKGICKVEWVSGHYTHVLSQAESHKYLGRALSLSKHRATTAVKFRISAAWCQFQKRRSILMNQNVCAILRTKLFNATVLPALLFGLSSLTLKPEHHNMLRGVRLKMIRNMAGWRRVDGEAGCDTMRRVRLRIESLLLVAASPNVSETIYSLKWRLAGRLYASTYSKWAPGLLQLPRAHSRGRGRPPMQWSDDVLDFCKWIREPCLESALVKADMEEKHVQFCLRKHL